MTTFGKLFVKVEGLSDEFCANVFNSTQPSQPKRYLCAGGRQQIFASDGDLSGPLMAVDQIKNHSYWYLVGIINRNIPGMYTRISDYVDWIESNIRP